MSRAIETSHRLAEAPRPPAGRRGHVEVRRKADDPTVTALAGYTRTNHVDGVRRGRSSDWRRA